MLHHQTRHPARREQGLHGQLRGDIRGHQRIEHRPASGGEDFDIVLAIA